MTVSLFSKILLVPCFFSLAFDSVSCAIQIPVLRDYTSCEIPAVASLAVYESSP